MHIFYLLSALSFRLYKENWLHSLAFLYADRRHDASFLFFDARFNGEFFLWIVCNSCVIIECTLCILWYEYGEYCVYSLVKIAFFSFSATDYTHTIDIPTHYFLTGKYPNRNWSLVGDISCSSKKWGRGKISITRGASTKRHQLSQQQKNSLSEQTEQRAIFALRFLLVSSTQYSC